MANGQYEGSEDFTDDLNLLLTSLAKAKEIMGKREFVHWIEETDKHWSSNMEDAASELLESVDEAVKLALAFEEQLCNLD